jgi:hypothetical protein
LEASKGVEPAGVDERWFGSVLAHAAGIGR